MSNIDGEEFCIEEYLATHKVRKIFNKKWNNKQ